VIVHLADAQPGDVVTRLLGEAIEMSLYVTEVTATLIVCGDWTFSKENGAEIDEFLGWNEKQTGSRITKIERN
jgi:hypothetical protein